MTWLYLQTSRELNWFVIDNKKEIKFKHGRNREIYVVINPEYQNCEELLGKDNIFNTSPSSNSPTTYWFRRPL